METTMIYLLKVSAVLTLFYIIYQGLLKRETFFKGNRLFLLLGFAVAFITPLLYITKYITLPAYSVEATNLSPLYYAKMSDTPLFNWQTFMGIIYLVGLGLLSIRFFIQLLSLRKLIGNGKSTSIDGFHLVETKQDIAPFSFFNFIVYNPLLYNEKELSAILDHEREHSLQHHSVDVILAHLAVIVLWINPFVWLYKKSIQQNLEFLADRSATRELSSIRSYQKTLLKISGNQYCTLITNNFYNSLIKKRIVMLNTSKSKSRNIWKYSLIIPLLVAFVFTFNTRVVAQKKESKKLVEETQLTAFSINKQMTNDELKALKLEVKEEIGGYFKYSGLKRNQKGYITSIKVELGNAKGSRANSSFNNDKGIPDIFFESNSDGVFINSSGHQDHATNAFSYKTGAGKKETYRVKKSGAGKGSNIYVHSGSSDSKEIEIVEENGEVVIRLNGEEITKEELEEYQKNRPHKARYKVRKLKDKDKNKGAYIIKDGDDEHDIEVIDSDSGNYFFIDSDGEEPLFLIDSKEVSQEKVKALSPDAIESISVLKGEKATEKFGSKGKKGVVEIITKKHN